MVPFTWAGGIPCEVPGAKPTSPLMITGPVLAIEEVDITAKLPAEPRLMEAWPVPTTAPVVKFQGSGTAPVVVDNGLPERSVTRFEIVAVYCVLAARLAKGVKVAIWLAGS